MSHWDRLPPVLAGFPGVGKSTLAAQDTRVWDAESQPFSWLAPGVRNPAFPQNYLDHVRTLLTQGYTVLTSTHAVVRAALRAAAIPYGLVYPTRASRPIYLARYRDRGSPEAFCTLLETQWDAWITDCEHDPTPWHWVLPPDHTLADVFLSLR